MWFFTPILYVRSSSVVTSSSVVSGRCVVFATAAVACFSVAPHLPLSIHVSTTSDATLPLSAGSRSFVKRAIALGTFGAPLTSWYSPTARMAGLRSSTR